MRTLVIENYTPKVRDYCNKIVVDPEKQLVYIYDCDGVWTKFISANQEGATEEYVDAAMKQAIAAAKTYTDASAADTLSKAQRYTDEHIPNA